MFNRSKLLADQATETLGMVQAVMPAIHDAAEEAQHLGEVLRETTNDARRAATATAIGVAVLATVAIMALLVASAALIFATEQ